MRERLQRKFTFGRCRLALNFGSLPLFCLHDIPSLHFVHEHMPTLKIRSVRKALLLFEAIFLAFATVVASYCI